MLTSFNTHCCAQLLHVLHRAGRCGPKIIYRMSICNIYLYMFSTHKGKTEFLVKATCARCHMHTHVQLQMHLKNDSDTNYWSLLNNNSSWIKYSDGVFQPCERIFSVGGHVVTLKPDAVDRLVWHKIRKTYGRWRVLTTVLLSFDIWYHISFLVQISWFSIALSSVQLKPVVELYRLDDISLV